VAGLALDRTQQRRHDASARWPVFVYFVSLLGKLIDHLVGDVKIGSGHT
jgi:hypothetical protein